MWGQGCGQLGWSSPSPEGGACARPRVLCCFSALRAGPAPPRQHWPRLAWPGLGLHRACARARPLPPEPACWPVPAWPRVQASSVHPRVDVSPCLSPGFLWRISAWTRPCLSKCPEGRGRRGGRQDPEGLRRVSSLAEGARCAGQHLFASVAASGQGLRLGRHSCSGPTWALAVASGLRRPPMCPALPARVLPKEGTSE